MIFALCMKWQWLLLIWKNIQLLHFFAFWCAPFCLSSYIFVVGIHSADKKYTSCPFLLYNSSKLCWGWRLKIFILDDFDMLLLEYEDGFLIEFVNMPGLQKISKITEVSIFATSTFVSPGQLSSCTFTLRVVS